MRKKHWWILPALAILVILTLIALDERLILRTYTVASPKLTAEVRLAVVTDFHSSDNAEEVAAMVASCAPDAVLLVGDLFDDDTANRPTERTLSLMRQLSAQYPCYYVSGNGGSGGDSAADVVRRPDSARTANCAVRHP